MKAVIFSRVSTQKQEYERQNADLLAFAGQKGYEVVKVFSEKISGYTKNEQRPIFQEMLEYCTKHGVKTVLIAELSRLSRKSAELLQIVEDFKAKGINLIVQSPFIETYPNGTHSVLSDFFITVLSAVAQMEKNTTQQRMQSGRQQAVRNGVKMGRKQGSIKAKEKYMEEYQEAVLLLKKKVSINQVARLLGKNPKTIALVKKILL
jgi:DNA invertase Pin-like site-specific DNA recombinase